VKTYTTVQVAKLLGVGRDTIYRWMRANKIPSGKVIPVGVGASFQARQWTERDVERIRKYKQENYLKGRGRKPKPKR
jgi:excisionase family DNA binding protein